MIKNYKDLLSMFLTLSGGQSGPYKKWKELCTPSNGEPKDINIILMAILLYRELITLCPKFESQSFENFLFIVKLIERIGLDENITNPFSIIESIRRNKDVAIMLIENGKNEMLKSLIDESIWGQKEIQDLLVLNRFDL